VTEIRAAIDPHWREAGIFPVISEAALRATLGILARTVARVTFARQAEARQAEARQAEARQAEPAQKDAEFCGYRSSWEAYNASKDARD